MSDHMFNFEQSEVCVWQSRIIGSVHRTLGSREEELVLLLPQRHYGAWLRRPLVERKSCRSQRTNEALTLFGRLKGVGCLDIVAIEFGLEFQQF